jgi:hypothetical protein
MEWVSRHCSAGRKLHVSAIGLERGTIPPPVTSFVVSMRNGDCTVSDAGTPTSFGGCAAIPFRALSANPLRGRRRWRSGNPCLPLHRLAHRRNRPIFGRHQCLHLLVRRPVESFELGSARGGIQRSSGRRRMVVQVTLGGVSCHQVCPWSLCCGRGKNVANFILSDRYRNRVLRVVRICRSVLGNCVGAVKKCRLHGPGIAPTHARTLRPARRTTSLGFSRRAARRRNS